LPCYITPHAPIARYATVYSFDGTDHTSEDVFESLLPFVALGDLLAEYGMLQYEVLVSRTAGGENCIQKFSRETWTAGNTHRVSRRTQSVFVPMKTRTQPLSQKVTTWFLHTECCFFFDNRMLSFRPRAAQNIGPVLIVTSTPHDIVTQKWVDYLSGNSSCIRKVRSSISGRHPVIMTHSLYFSQLF